MALCNERALPSPLLAHLMLKTGQFVEGCLKLHLLHHPIPSTQAENLHAAFDEVEGRPRRYSHHLLQTWEAVADWVRLPDPPLNLLEKWANFATWTRYPHDTPEFLQKAALMYKELHTEEEHKERERLGLTSQGKEHLLGLQKGELLQEIETLFDFAHALLLCYPE